MSKRKTKRVNSKGTVVSYIPGVKRPWTEDLSGKRFGFVVVTGFLGVSKEGNVWETLCDCGNKSLGTTSRLNAGKSTHCGCKYVNPYTTHNMTKTPLYFIWAAMKKRCTDVNGEHYAQYGGRGIKVCDSWQKFENFYADMNEGYCKGLWIDRIDNDGDYCPENCRWATPSEQQRNKGTNRWFEKNGIKMIGVDWAKYFGVSYSSLFNKLKKYSFEEAYDYYMQKLSKTK